MVLIKHCESSTSTASACELMLESQRTIRYVAPMGANPRNATRSCCEDDFSHQRKSLHDASTSYDDWEGVNALVQHLDTVIDVERETDFFDGKRVLEIGFSTGLLSVFAMDSGASEVTVHCATKAELDCFVRPTLKRNAIPKTKCKFSTGGLKELKKALGGKKFDVILAPEILCCDHDDLEKVHEILDLALAQDGICFLSSRTHYFHCEGSLPAFLDIIKRNRKFDSLERWSSDHSEIVPRKILQLTRSIF